MRNPASKVLEVRKGCNSGMQRRLVYESTFTCTAAWCGVAGVGVGRWGVQMRVGSLGKLGWQYNMTFLLSPS